MNLTVDELATVVVNELSWINFMSIVTIVIMTIAIVYLVHRCNQLDAHVMVIERELKRRGRRQKEPKIKVRMR